MSVTYAEQIPLQARSPLTVKAQATVSVVIPCYNEERYIGKALDNLILQYPTDAYEIIVVDGMSNDRTREIVSEFRNRHPGLAFTMIDNPARNIPSALNIGIAKARGQIIARMDAHAAPSRGYIRRCVDVIDEGAAVVGMPCRIQPGDSTTTARAIAIAVSHSFGIGDAKYRLTNGAGQEDVDTVAFACFRKSLWTELHGFDETLLTNEDYDFNYRAKVRGGRVLLDRSEYCDYFARPTLTDLAKQYLRYGQWKARMILTRPASIKLRHVVAPAFVASIFIFAAIGLWQRAFWAILGLEAALYLLASIFFSARAARQMGAGIRVMAMLPLVFFTIHFCWGSSFLRGLLQRPR